MSNNLLDFQVPMNKTLINQSFKQLFKFSKIIQLFLTRQSDSKHSISLSESLAFRLLASIDWSEIDSDEFKKTFSPILSLKHLGLDSHLIKSHTCHLRFKENEVKDALYLWSKWRTNLNNNLEFAEKDYGNKNTNDNNLVKKDDDLMTLYAISKWSINNSSLKFGTYLHYGIPRAKLLPSSLVEDESPELPNSTYTVCSNVSEQNNTTFIPSPTNTIPYENKSNQSIMQTPINSKTQAWVCNSNQSDEFDRSFYESVVSPRSENANKTFDSGISVKSLSPNNETNTYYYRRKHVDKINERKSKHRFIRSHKPNTKEINKIGFKKNNSAYDMKNSSVKETTIRNIFGNKEVLKTEASFSGKNRFNQLKNVNTNENRYNLTSFDSTLNAINNSNNLNKSKNITKVNAVKGGLVTTFGNVYFPSK